MDKKLNICNTGNRRSPKSRAKKFKDFQFSETIDPLKSIGNSMPQLAPLIAQAKASQRLDQKTIFTVPMSRMNS